MNRELPRGQHPHGGGTDDGVQAAISALSGDEPHIAHAVRLAAVIRSADTDTTERLQLLHRVLTLDQRAARQVALDIADDPQHEVRAAACGVLASTLGSEDDLPRLLSLVADERLSGQAEALQIAIDAVQAPDPAESIALLLRLVDLGDDCEGISIELLVPAPMHRSQLLRWINKAWSRAADHRQSQRFLDAARVVGGIVIDQTVLGGAAAGEPLGLSATELDQIAHGLRDRPTPLQLVDRRAIRVRYPWIDAYAELGVRGSAARPPRMSVLGARDIATATATLRLLVQGWLAEVRSQR